MADTNFTIYFSAIKSSKESTNSICSSLLAPEGQPLSWLLVSKTQVKQENQNPSTLWPIANTLPDIHSPFDIDTWTDCLSCRPDQTLANYLLSDIHSGANVGFPWKRDSRIYENHFSATTNPEAVAKQLKRKLSHNRKIGPFLTPPFSNLSDRRWALLLNSTRCPQNGTTFTIYHGSPYQRWYS